MRGAQEKRRKAEHQKQKIKLASCQPWIVAVLMRPSDRSRGRGGGGINSESSDDGIGGDGIEIGDLSPFISSLG